MDVPVFESLLQARADTIFQTDCAANEIEQFTTDDNAELVDVGLVGRSAVFGIKHARRIRRRLTIVEHFNRQQSLLITVDRNFNRFAGRAATDSPGNEVEKRLPQLSLIGDDGCDLGASS